MELKRKPPPKKPCPYCRRPMKKVRRLGKRGWTCEKDKYAIVRTGRKDGHQDQD